MKVAVTSRDFYANDRRAMELLERAGLEIDDHSLRAFGSGSCEEEIAEAVGDAEILIIGMEPCRRLLLERCKNLKMISRRGVGCDNIDRELCRERGITVARAVGTVEGAVAEHVLADILHFSRRLDLQNDDMQHHVWARRLVGGAKNHTLGLVGFGGIGKEVARRARPFGMRILYHCRHPQKEWEAEFGVQFCELEELLRESDYVAICVPLTEETQNLFDARLLSRMKPGSYLINIARGGIIVEEDLREAILSGRVAGAAVDAFPNEPCTDSPLVGVPNVILTPHTAAYTQENFDEINLRAAQNVLDYLDGRLEEKYRLV